MIVRLAVIPVKDFENNSFGVRIEWSSPCCARWRWGWSGYIWSGTMRALPRGTKCRCSTHTLGRYWTSVSFRELFSKIFSFFNYYATKKCASIIINYLTSINYASIFIQCSFASSQTSHVRPIKRVKTWLWSKY